MMRADNELSFVSNCACVSCVVCVCSPDGQYQSNIMRERINQIINEVSGAVTVIDCRPRVIVKHLLPSVYDGGQRGGPVDIDEHRTQCSPSV